MSKRKRILLMLAKGGVSQSEVAAALHASKRDVSACAKALRERSLTFDDVSAMSAAEVEGMLAPPAGPPAESAYLQPDMGALIERKRRNRKLTVKMFWMEHCEAAAAAGRSAYVYQTFCEMFSRAAEKAGATRRLAHVNLPRFRLHPYAAIGWRSSSGQLARSNSSGLRYPSAECVLTLL